MRSKFNKFKHVRGARAPHAGEGTGKGGVPVW